MAYEIRADAVENHAISGARVQDLPREIASSSRTSYRYILVGIGANDVTRFANTDETAALLKDVLQTLPVHEHLIVYMAGNVGGSLLFPRVLNPFYTKQTLAYHAAFKPIVEAAHGTYVNLYIDPAHDPFQLHPDDNFAADGFHPSSAGYRIWFEKIRPVLQ